METSSQPQPTIDLSTPLYYQLVNTLTDLLPPALDDTPESLHARNLAAIAKIAALLPVNANEADLAAQCIAARAQAEEMLRLVRQNADDIALVMRLNAQYGSMVRAARGKTATKRQTRTPGPRMWPSVRCCRWLIRMPRGWKRRGPNPRHRPSWTKRSRKPSQRMRWMLRTWLLRRG